MSSMAASARARAYAAEVQDDPLHGLAAKVTTAAHQIPPPDPRGLVAFTWLPSVASRHWFGLINEREAPKLNRPKVECQLHLSE
jgi:hypothetical protein